MKRIPESAKILSPEKAYILGVLCGDGYISKNGRSNFEIGLNTIDEEFALRFKSFLERVYHLISKERITPPSTHKIRGKLFRCKKQTRIRLNSKEVYEDLLKYNPIGRFKEKDWRIPKEIMVSKDEKIICSFLRGFLDSEASVCNLFISIFSANKKGLDDIKKLLCKIDIERFRFYCDKKGVWKLVFCGKDNLYIISKRVGFTIKRKQTKLEKQIEYKNKTKPPDYWLVLHLRMKGLGYRRIAKLTGIYMWSVRDWYEGRSIPYQVRRQIRLKHFPENWEILCKKFLFFRPFL